MGRCLLTGFGVRFVRGRCIRFLMVVPVLMMRAGRQQATHWKWFCMSCHRAWASMCRQCHNNAFNYSQLFSESDRTLR